jgi:hypothetical protein
MLTRMRDRGIPKRRPEIYPEGIQGLSPGF